MTSEILNEEEVIKTGEEFYKWSCPPEVKYSLIPNYVRILTKRWYEKYLEDSNNTNSFWDYLLVNHSPDWRIKTELWIINYQEGREEIIQMNFFNLPLIGNKSIVITKGKLQDNKEVFDEVESLIKTLKQNTNNEEEKTKTILSIYELVKHY